MRPENLADQPEAFTPLAGDLPFQASATSATLPVAAGLPENVALL